MVIQKPDTVNVYLLKKIACLEGCFVCPNANMCSECGSPLIIKHDDSGTLDTCVSDCGIRYYVDLSNLPLTCMKCDFRCLSCLGPENTNCPNCDASLEGVVKTGSRSCDCDDRYTPNFSERKCECIFLLYQ